MQHARLLAAGGLLALSAAACVHSAAAPVYVMSLRGSTGPAPVLAVAYSRVVGPPVEVPRPADAGVAFLRPAADGLALVARARRDAALHADLHAHPTYLHGAIGGPRPWVALADEDWVAPREALRTRDLRGRALAPLAGRTPAGLADDFVALEEQDVVARGDDGALRWRHRLETAAPTSCSDDDPDSLEPLVTVSPTGTVIAAVQGAVHRGATCVETVARLARFAPDGTRRSPDAVLRLTPPDALWAAAPDPSRYGTSSVRAAVRDDGTVLLAASTRQPGAAAQSGDQASVRLFVVTPDGTMRDLRVVPGATKAVATAGPNWLLVLEPPPGGTELAVVVLGEDGRTLTDLAIPRRNVAVLPLPDRAFVAWRANERDVCGLSFGEDGRRSRVACRRVVP